MKHRTKISWADFTVNGWEGCTKVSKGCRLCYAKTRNDRNLQGPVSNWGKGAPRRSMVVNAIKSLLSLNRAFAPWGTLGTKGENPGGYAMMLEDDATGERWMVKRGKAGVYSPDLSEVPDTWKDVACIAQPDGVKILKRDGAGNIIATATIVRPQVFSLSLGDILDHEIPTEWRARYLAAIGQATHLEFLLLTKRPELFQGLLEQAICWATPSDPQDAIDRKHLVEPLTGIHAGELAHIAWGTSLEDNEVKDRVFHLAKIPAHRRFISAEPLLGDPGLAAIFAELLPDTIHLVISGGESGVQANPTHPWWIENIDRDCQEYGVPHHFKQWGTWAPAELCPLEGPADNPGNRRTIDVWQGHKEWEGTIKGGTILMHRTPNKEAVKPLINGQLQQPRLRF